MPILFMALLALLVFLVTGALLCLAVISESRQRDKIARRQTSVPVERQVEDTELVHR